jgi:di/tricarboxylate transporter
MVTVGLWILEPLHHVDPAFIGLLAIVLIFLTHSLDDFSNSIDWSSLFHIGCLLSLAIVMQSTGISDWMANGLRPFLGSFMGNKILFLLTICFFSYVVRTLVTSFFALFAVLFPWVATIGMSIGIHPLVIAVVILWSYYAFFHPYMSVPLLAAKGMLKGEGFTDKQAIKFGVAYILANVGTLFLSFLYWQAINVL